MLCHSLRPCSVVLENVRSINPSDKHAVNVDAQTLEELSKHVQLVEAHKGGVRLLLDGYIYVRSKSNDKKIYWRCIHHRDRCPGALRTTNIINKNPSNNETPQVLHPPTEHNHGSNKPVALQMISAVSKFIKEMPVQRLKDPYDCVRNADAFHNVDQLLIPTCESDYKIMNRQRASFFPKLLQSHERYRHIETSEQFYDGNSAATGFSKDSTDSSAQLLMAGHAMADVKANKPSRPRKAVRRLKRSQHDALISCSKTLTPQSDQVTADINRDFSSVPDESKLADGLSEDLNVEPYYHQMTHETETLEELSKRAQLVEAKKGGVKLLLDGYIYGRMSTYQKKLYWRCNQNENCPGKLQTNQLVNPASINESPKILASPISHNHAPNRGKALRISIISALRTRLKEGPVKRLKDLYDAVINTDTFKNEDQTLIPTYGSIQTILRREYNKSYSKHPGTAIKRHVILKRLRESSQVLSHASGCTSAGLGMSNGADGGSPEKHTKPWHNTTWETETLEELSKRAQLVEAHKGGVQLLFDGYIYVRCRCCDTKVYWHCIHKESCTGTLHTKPLTDQPTNDQPPAFLSRPLFHNHAPDKSRALRMTILAAVRKRVKDAPLNSVRDAYDAVINAREDRDLLPSYESVRTIMQRQQNASKKYITEGNWPMK